MLFLPWRIQLGNCSNGAMAVSGDPTNSNRFRRSSAICCVIVCCVAQRCTVLESVVHSISHYWCGLGWRRPWQRQCTMARCFHGFSRRRSPFEVLNFSSLLNPHVRSLAVFPHGVSDLVFSWQFGLCFCFRKEAQPSVNLPTTVLNHRSVGNSHNGWLFYIILYNTELTWTTTASDWHLSSQIFMCFDAFSVTHHV